MIIIFLLAIEDKYSLFLSFEYSWLVRSGWWTDGVWERFPESRRDRRFVRESAEKKIEKNRESERRNADDNKRVDPELFREEPDQRVGRVKKPAAFREEQLPAGLIPKIEAKFDIEREDLEGEAVKMTFSLKQEILLDMQFQIIKNLGV